MSDTTSFAALLGSLAADGDAHIVTVPPDWQQGRTAFGGLTAAFAVAAARRHHPDLPPLRAGQFAFIGPAAGTLRFETRVVRAGRSVRFLAVDATAEAGPALHALLCFGSTRDSAFGFRDAPPDTAPPEACAPLPRGDAPAFLQHFHTRLAGASAPFSGGAPDLAAWVSHLDPPGPDAAEAALLALADVLPPSALCMATGMLPLSTMTWSVELAPGAADATPGWCLSRRHASFIAEGYVGEAVSLHREDGTLLLTGRQSVALFG